MQYKIKLIIQQMLIFFVVISAFVFDLQHYFLRYLPVSIRRALLYIQGHVSIYDSAVSQLNTIYTLNETLLGVIFTGIALLWAIQSFLYDHLKNYSYGITLDTIYQRVYKDDLAISRTVLLIGAPASFFTLLSGFAITSLAIFIIVFIHLLLEFSHTVLISDLKKRRIFCLKSMKEELFSPDILLADKITDCIFYRILSSRQPKEADTVMLINQYIAAILDLNETAVFMRPADYFHHFFYITKLILMGNLMEQGDEADVSLLRSYSGSIAGKIQDIHKSDQNSCDSDTARAAGALITPSVTELTSCGIEYIFRLLAASLGVLIASSVCCDKHIPGDKKALLLLKGLLNDYIHSPNWNDYGFILLAAWSVFIDLSYQKGRKIEPLYNYLTAQKLTRSRRLSFLQYEKNQDLLLSLSVLYSDLDFFTYSDVLNAYERMIADIVRESGSECQTYPGQMGLWEDLI